MGGEEGEEEMDLLAEEAGMPKEESKLADISDEDLMAEAEKRGLIEPEDMAEETDLALEGDAGAPMDDSAL